MPSEELGVHFCPHLFCIVVQHEGSWMGLGPFTVWQMVDYPNKHTNYPGFPLCAWALLKAAEGPATRPANSGSAGTEGCSHTSPVLFPGVFIILPYVPIFHCQLLLIPLPFGKVCAQPDLRGLLFQYNSPSLFRWRLFMPLIWGWSLQMGLFWLISSFSVAPYTKQCNYDEKANKWPMFNQNLL